MCLLAAGSAWARTAGARAVPLVVKAPAVTKNPVSKTVEAGQSATFEAAASGTPTPTVQWEVSTDGGSSWAPVPEATSTAYTIASTVASENGYEFRATFTNEAGSDTSKTATLTVRSAPEVTKQPQSVTVQEGENATFEATASGTPAPTVQWQMSSNGGTTFSSIKEATSNQLVIAKATSSLSGHEYRAIFNNAAGKVTTEAATLTVQKTPTVTEQPVSVSAKAGEAVSFESAASGFPAPAAQWEVSTDGGAEWSQVPGASAEKLTIAEASISENGYEYRATFTNTAGHATSEPATLTVHAPPQVSKQPASTIVLAGENAVFEAAATGLPEPTVQWERSTDHGGTWSAVGGATGDVLTVEGATTAQSGYEYRAVFTNTGGVTDSAAAILTVATSKFSAVAWGGNLDYQLGSGSTADLSDVPVPVKEISFVSAVAAGGLHSLALLVNGTVMAWGGNGFGQLGNGTMTIEKTPVEVEGLTGVTAIAAGENHSLALLSNGTVMAWGDGEEGQLGDAKLVESEVPVQVKGLTGVKAIAAGGNHSLALLSNGTVMAWGENEDGELGNGNHNQASSPVAVKSLTGVTAIAAGGNFSLALTNKETVVGWGSDATGQLADSAVSEDEGSAVPVPADGLTGVTAIAAGGTHALALLGDKTVKAWGEDSYGQLGDGAIKGIEETPQAVSGLSNVTAISAGKMDSVAMLGTGAVATWGINSFGQLGDGATGSPSDVPVEVAGVRRVASISAGGQHMLAFGEQLPTVSGVSPSRGPAAGGTPVTISGVALNGATKVTFGGVEATNVTVESSSAVTATAPAGKGTVDVEVTTPAGTSAPVSADRYTYLAPPTVKKLSVKAGPATGGTTVVITGTEFTGATAVHFGEAEAQSVTVKSATSITAVSPPNTGGTVDVTVTGVGGTSAKVSADHFKYTPVVEEVSPGGGPAAGGTPVSVRGVGFLPGATGTTFKFGKTKATGVTCSSSTACTMKAPKHAAETVDVTALVAKAVSLTSEADRYTYS